MVLQQRKQIQDRQQNKDKYLWCGDQRDCVSEIDPSPRARERGVRSKINQISGDQEKIRKTNQVTNVQLCATKPQHTS